MYQEHRHRVFDNADHGGAGLEGGLDRQYGSRGHQVVRQTGRRRQRPLHAERVQSDPSGKIIGFDVDLMNAIAATLGLTPDYREADFDKIIPSIQGGTFNVGMSSFTDTKNASRPSTS